MGLPYKSILVASMKSEVWTSSLCDIHGILLADHLL